MTNLGKIDQIAKTGEEPLIFMGKLLPFNLKDFWIWSESDILSNATRGRFAEFIVATATHIDLKTPREEWGSYDLLTPDKIKIEIKSSAYIQSWHQNKLSSINFSIKPARHWDSETGIQANVAQRYSDVYVMCLLKHTDQDTLNPLDMTQWIFYVLSRYEVDNYKRSQSSITLRSLEKLTSPVDYINLYKEIQIKNRNNL